MLRSQLISYSGNDPIWGFVALVGSERFTGETVVGVEQRVHLFSVDGLIYYAEHADDLAIGARLVNCGAISPAQLEHGAVDVAGVQSLARLFQRQPHVDRDAVELTIQHATESLLESVATKPAGTPEVFPLRHHPAGIHHWLRSVAVSVPHVVRDEAPTVAAEPVGVEASAPVVEPPAVIEPPVVVDTPVATEPEPEAEAYVPDAPDMVEVEAPTELDGARTAELPVLEVPQLEMPVLQVPVLESPPMPEPEPEPEPEPVVAEAVPMMAPLSLQPLTPLASQMPTIAPPPEPEPQPEPLALESEPEPEPASDPLMSRLAPLPANAAMTAAEAASIFVPTTDDIPGLDDLPELSSVAYLPSVATEALSTPSLPTMPAMPTMPSMPERPAPTPAPSFGFDSSEQTAAVEMAEAAGLPKLASAPYDVDAMQMNPALDAARVAAGQPHNLAAVEIWELVDHMLVEPGAPSGTPAANPADDKPAGRGRLRGRKG